MFGQKPLARPPSPERLDSMMRVVPSFAWISLIVIAAAAIIALVWSIFSHAEVKVVARGVLISRDGVADIVSPQSGRLKQVLVRPGQTVNAGQVIALLGRQDLEEGLKQRQVERAKLEERAAAIETFLARQAAARSASDSSRQHMLRQRLAALRQTEKTTMEMLAGQEDLLRKGFSTRDRLLALRQQVEDVRSQADQAEADLLGLSSDATGAVIQARREMLEIEMNLAAADRDIAAGRRNLRNAREVVAPIGGTVAEQLVNVGEMAEGGAPLFRILPAGARPGGNSLVGLLYVPPTAGMQAVRVGMPVQIIPNSARVQRDGFIRGNIVEVSTLPVTPEGMQRVLKNATLVESLSAAGAPIQAIVKLEADPATPSGFRWSGGRGPSQRISPGTVSEGKIVTDEVPMIALLIPRIEGLLAKIGL